MIEEILSTLLRHWPTAILILTIAYLAKNRYHNGLQKYPGPILASLTDWWRFFDVLGRRPDITHIELHRKHGDIIRYGPNALSFANPQALKTIYGLNKGFIKVRNRNDHYAYVAAETLQSPISTPSNRPCQKASGFPPSSQQQMNNTMPSSAVASTALSQCPRSFNTNRL